ncbi:MAG TPA: glucokinase [Gemmatimonadaceae bacterium]
MHADAGRRAIPGTADGSGLHPVMREGDAMLLVGDIGGTNARLALVSASEGPHRFLRQATLPSADYRGARELVTAFLRDADVRVDGIVLAVAGPVVEGRAVLSNLGWVVEADALRDELGVSDVRLLNDLVALATAIPHIEPAGLRTLQAGDAEPGGAIAVVAPGTGLGESFLLRDGARYRAYASEGGHADFAPADELQMELLEWMRRRVDHVSFERVCSGRALPDLYDFLAQRRGAPSPRRLPHAAPGEDRTPAIVDAALDAAAPCALSRGAIDLFAAILAAEAGNAALRVLATGGVYLAGGMPKRMLAALETPEVRERFLRKGRLAPLLARVPLHVVTQPRVALLGAACHALAGTGAAPGAAAAADERAGRPPRRR